MALDTFANLKLSIDDWLARNDLSGVANDLIALCERELNNKLRAKEMETRFAFQITTQFSDLPTDFLGARELKVLTNATDVPTYATPQYLDEKQVRGVSGTPEIFTIRGTELYLSKIPSITAAQTVSSLTSSGTTVTMTTAADHNLNVSSSITVSGAVETAYNGTFEITEVVDSTSVKYIAASTPSATPATGTPVYIVNNAELTYWQAVTALSDANTTNTILTNYPDAYLFGSLKQAVSYTQNGEALSFFNQRFEQALADANTTSENARFTGSNLQMRFN